MGRVLILDGMWNKSLSAVRSFGRKGFHVAAGERSRLSTALFSRYCERRVIYPSPLKNHDEFFDSIEEELARGCYDVIFPMELSTQLLITGQRKRFERYVKIPFADPAITKAVHDKDFLMKYAKDNGFDVPKTWSFSCIEDVGDISNTLPYPLMIKPRNSSGSRGITIVRNKKELLSSYKIVHERYPLPLVQDYIPPGGDSYGVGLLLNFNSDVRASFVYRRLRSYPVSGGPSTLRESAQRDDLRESAELLMRSLKWKGVAHVEFKIDPRDGRPKLLEVNPRFWGSLELAIRSGVDFPFLLYKMAMEGDVAPQKSYDLGIRCRWLLPGDMLHFLHNPERFHLDPDFFDFSINDDIISLHDPWPIVGRLTSLLAFLYHNDLRNLINH